MRVAHPSDASFFIGRAGLHIPEETQAVTIEDEDVEISPARSLFYFFSSLCEANGIDTGKVPHDENIRLPARGYLPAVVLRSKYNGLSDEELAAKKPPIRTKKPPLGWESNNIQGVEDFALYLGDKLGWSEKHPSASRTNLLVSRIYHYDLHSPALHEAGQPPAATFVPRAEETDYFAALIDGAPLTERHSTALPRLTNFIIDNLLLDADK